MQNMKINGINEVLLEEYPGYVFWKDPESTYLGCNRNFAAISGLNCPDEIIGKSDKDLPWLSTEMKQYIKNDQQVMKSADPLINIIERQTDSQKNRRICITSKYPIFKENLDIAGIIGLYRFSNEVLNLGQHLLSFSHDVISDSEKIHIKNIKSHLTKKEVECLRFIIRGFSAKKIARILGVSSRTTEKHIENIKLKFNVKTTGHIIATLFNSEIIDYD